MSKKTDINLIKDLSNANGPSGFEDEVVDYINASASKYSNVEVDHMNNCYLSLPNGISDKTVMLDAHSDEVGLIVQAVKPDGTVKFVPIGGWIPANLTAQKMRVRNRDGKWITGLVGTKPPHFMTADERKQPVDASTLTIDFGTTSAQETKEVLHIDTGCPIVPDTQFEYFEDRDIMIGKAFDNRVGTAVLMTAIQELAEAGEQIAFNVVGAIASQEEVGCRGAKVTTKRVHPDIAICIEGCPADDTFTPDWLSQTGLKRGPMLRDMDSTFIANPKFQQFAIEQAEKNNIPYTRSVRSGGGMDGSELLLDQGAPTICVGLPVRYEHTNYAIVAYDDFKNTVKLVKDILLNLNDELLASF
ncbi:M42 family metallopeptidase [Lactobacillaceae bacterium Melli_B4]